MEFQGNIKWLFFFYRCFLSKNDVWKIASRVIQKGYNFYEQILRTNVWIYIPLYSRACHNFLIPP